ncbi:MAG TPA: uroporphyrinogen decarboxylase family protein [Candidatus Saccharimonadales bacterium]|nr:uroporphyrinogen decarboxylase family protein [Candidatus Saccharimonadales bacterium]
MTHKETIASLIRLQETPRLPVSLLSGGAWTLNRGGLTMERALAESPARLAEIIASTNEQVKCDIVWPGSGYHNLAIRGAGGTIKFRAKGTPDVMAPLIESARQIDYSLITRMKDDPGIRLLAETARILSRSIGAHTTVGTSQWAPFTLGGLAYGVEKMMRSVYKDKAAVHAVLEFSAELCFAYLEPFIEAGVSIVSLADPTSSGDLISREQFAEFSLPYLKRVGAKVKERGVWLTVHICGNTTNRLDLIPQSGADIMSVDYKVDLSEARRILNGKIAFAGNMNPVEVMQKETPGGVAEACRQTISKAGASAGFLLMPGCDIPPSVPIDNVKAMVETAHEYCFSQEVH